MRSADGNIDTAAFVWFRDMPSNTSRLAILSLIVVLVPASASAQGEGQLFKTLASLDEAVFDAYNKCELNKFRTLFVDDVEFYHDQGGLTTGIDNLTAQLQKNICGKTRRELVPGSLEVHELKGFGAVQMGSHRFFSPIESENPVGAAKFIHIWRLKDGVWQITRVISYDHRSLTKR
jgi:hypothetical protein